ncbi:MAG: hypothetical protein J0L64_14550 [Acidobacteria bacterium]|nr:hypothetical protein [Acidobacteriota bacterium]
MKRFTVASDPGSEDLTQRVTHYYDSNPFDGSFTQNGAGRRTATVYYMRRSGYSPPNPLNGQIIEMYSYSTGGLLTKKRFTAVLQNPVDTYNNVSNYTDVEYTYDSEGRRTQMVYPKGRYRATGSQGAPWMQDASRTLNYTYDSMGRAHTMAEPSPGPSPGSSWLSGVTYNAASQPANFSGLGETRTYNILGQLTQITAGSSFSERYVYSATARTGPRRSPAPLCARTGTKPNGRITGKKNLLSGEEVQYTYDSLQRLQSAITVTDPLVTQWGQNFTYDGWGNLLGASVAKGSAPTFSVTVNGLTNRITGQSYDANGNQAVNGSSYDVENRLKGAGTYPNYYQYTYDGSNKRVAKSKPLTSDEDGNVNGEELLMFYGAGGERLAEFTMSIVKFGTPSQWYLRFTEKKTLVWFGSELGSDCGPLHNGGASVTAPPK